MQNRESSVPRTRGQKRLAAARALIAAQDSARQLSVESATHDEDTVPAESRNSLQWLPAASGPPTKKLAVSSDAALHPSLFSRLPLPLQLWIASGVAPADLAAIGLVSKSARRFCELCFVHLQTFGTPGSDVDIPSLTLMLRFSTQLKSFDLGGLTISRRQLRRLDEQFPDNGGTYSGSGLTSRVLLHNARTLEVPPSWLPDDSLLAQCPRLQLLPCNCSVRPMRELDERFDDPPSPEETRARIARQLSAIVRSCSELCRLQLSCAAETGVVTPELLLQFVNERPLQELMLRGCDEESLRSIATASTTLGALRKLAISTSRWPGDDALRVAEIVPLLDLCRQSLRELCLEASRHHETLNLGRLPALERLLLPECNYLVVRLEAPLLTALYITPRCFAESVLQPSAFPRLNELHFLDWLVIKPRSLLELSGWQSLTALRICCHSKVADAVAMFALRTLRGLRELRVCCRDYEKPNPEAVVVPRAMRKAGTCTRFPELRVLECGALTAKTWRALELPALVAALTAPDAETIAAAVKAAPRLRELVLLCRVLYATGAHDLLAPLRSEARPFAGVASLHTVRLQVDDESSFRWRQAEYNGFIKALVDGQIFDRGPALRRVVLGNREHSLSRMDDFYWRSRGESREFSFDRETRAVCVRPPVPADPEPWSDDDADYF